MVPQRLLYRNVYYRALEAHHKDSVTQYKQKVGSACVAVPTGTLSTDKVAWRDPDLDPDVHKCEASLLLIHGHNQYYQEQRGLEVKRVALSY